MLFSIYLSIIKLNWLEYRHYHFDCSWNFLPLNLVQPEYLICMVLWFFFYIPGCIYAAYIICRIDKHMPIGQPPMTIAWIQVFSLSRFTSQLMGQIIHFSCKQILWKKTHLHWFWKTKNIDQLVCENGKNNTLLL